MSERVVLSVRVPDSEGVDGFYAGILVAELRKGTATVSGLDGARAVDACLGPLGSVLITLELPQSPTFTRDDPITDDRRRAS